MSVDPRTDNTWIKTACTLLACSLLALGCGAGGGDGGDNPFLDDFATSGKTDTGWVSSPKAPEVEVVLESDIHTPGRWQALTGPADLTQFALTYLRLASKPKLFIESQLVIPERERSIEWLLDGAWVPADRVDVYNTPLEKLNHFRVTGVTAVVYEPADPANLVGQVFSAKVPRYPYDLMGTAGETCASPGSHQLYDETYWYFWDPDRRDCQIETTELTATVTRAIPSDGPRYPEYDRLVEDGRVEAVVFFGAFGGTADIEADKGYKSMLSFMGKMEGAGFTQGVSPAGLARFSRTSGGIEQIVDVSSPADFEGLGDFRNAQVFDQAVRTHEIVVYNGHSIMGTSDFFRRQDIYPDGYQIFFFNGCLGYEYYVRAILEGKGDWENVDVISNIMETPASPQPKVIASFLAALFQGSAEAGSVSYKGILDALNRYTYNSCYGISGARTNCFSPSGSLCEDPEPEKKTYENDSPAEVPDADPAGVESTIQVPGSKTVDGLDIRIYLDHSWLGDLRITLEHEGVASVLWDRQDDLYGLGLQDALQTDAFDGLEAQGPWTLTISDHAAQDTGTLHAWSLTL